jgi:hypothetical protein
MAARNQAIVGQSEAGSERLEGRLEEVEELERSGQTLTRK